MEEQEPSSASVPYGIYVLSLFFVLAGLYVSVDCAVWDFPLGFGLILIAFCFLFSTGMLLRIEAVRILLQVALGLVLAFNTFRLFFASEELFWWLAGIIVPLWLDDYLRRPEVRQAFHMQTLNHRDTEAQSSEEEGGMEDTLDPSPES